jgi:nucleoside 2-deoxyribosyltransferase
LRNVGKKQQAASSKQQAASSKQQAASSKQQAARIELLRAQPILVYIGYDWGRWDESESAPKWKGLNRHWHFLRDTAETAAKALEKLASKRAGKAQLGVSVRRLRSRHGGTVLGTILRRIDEADVLIFDISGNNPNVLFELGYAVARKGIDSERIYFFSESDSPENHKAPSDLQCVMFTKYEKSEAIPSHRAAFSLKDAKGFQSALLSTLTEIAREREMLGFATAITESEI